MFCSSSSSNSSGARHYKMVMSDGWWPIMKNTAREQGGSTPGATIKSIVYPLILLVGWQALMGDNMTAPKALLREKPDVVVSTPAKLVAHLDAGNIMLKNSVESLGEETERRQGEWKGTQFF